MSDRIDSMEEDDDGRAMLSVSVFVTSLSVSANEFNWMEEEEDVVVVRRLLLLVGGINAFACPMESRSAATAVLLKIMVVLPTKPPQYIVIILQHVVEVAAGWVSHRVVELKEQTRWPGAPRGFLSP